MERILVACEESQRVTTAFRDIGYEAYSCDILPTSGDHPEWHLQQDVTDLLAEDWGMIIAFPPCTDLAVSGARYFARKQADGTQQRSINFFMQFANSECPRVAIENPIGIMSTIYRKPDQIIQPYWFGEPYKKSTCLWLKGLPKLEPTNMLREPEPFVGADGKYRMSQYMYDLSLKDHTQRAYHRSKTFLGVAEAMANQWGPAMKELF